ETLVSNRARIVAVVSRRSIPRNCGTTPKVLNRASIKHRRHSSLRLNCLSDHASVEARFPIGGGLCGYVGRASDDISSRVAAFFSGDCHIGAVRRVGFAQYRSRVGGATRRRFEPDMVASIRPPPKLLPLCIGSPRLSLSRRKRWNSHQFIWGRLVFPAGALCSSAVQCRKSWSGGSNPASDSRRRRRRSKRLDCPTGMGETGGD